MAKLGLQYAAKRRKELAKRLVEEEKMWRAFKDDWPDEAQVLEEVRENSAEFQKKLTYTLSDQMDQLYSLAFPMKPKRRKRMLKALSVVHPAKNGATPYLALMKAGSVAGYNNVRVSSRNAKKIEAGIVQGISVEDFAEWRKCIK